MTDDAPLSGEARPRLPRGVRLRRDETRDQWQLLAPERILQRCTGAATLDAIVDDLARAFKADRARIDTDVRAMLRGLADKKVLEL